MDFSILIGSLILIKKYVNCFIMCYDYIEVVVFIFYYFRKGVFNEFGY